MVRGALFFHTKSHRKFGPPASHFTPLFFVPHGPLLRPSGIRQGFIPYAGPRASSGHFSGFGGLFLGFILARVRRRYGGVAFSVRWQLGTLCHLGHFCQQCTLVRAVTLSRSVRIRREGLRPKIGTHQRNGQY